MNLSNIEKTLPPISRTGRTKPKKREPKSPPSPEKQPKNPPQKRGRKRKQDSSEDYTESSLETEKQEYLPDKADLLRLASLQQAATEPEQEKVLPILFAYQSAPHYKFLSASEDEVLLSGGRGSGKSSCLIVDPLRYCHKKRFRGLILRKTMKSLRELIRRAEDIYPQVFPGARFLKQESIFKFPSGAQIDFGYLDRAEDLAQYKGQEYQWVGFDELTEWGDEELFNLMIGSIRSIDPEIPVSIRACVDQGEVLTLRGWLPIQDVVVGDFVYSLDESGACKLNRVYSVSSYDVDEELVRVRKKNLFMSMTQDHRVVHRLANKSYATTKWNEHSHKTIRIARAPLVYEASGYEGCTFQDLDYNDWLAFLGIYLAEGSIKQTVHNGNYSCIVTQQKLESKNLIRELLSRFPIKFHEQANGDFVAHNKELWTYLKQFGKAKDKFVPRDILNTASASQLRILFDWLVLGDGHWQTSKSCTYVTTSKQLAEDIAEISAKLGFKAKITTVPTENENHNTRYNVYIVVRPPVTVVDKLTDVSLERYQGKVYCISVENNDNFIIKQQDTVWVSGNTTNPDGPGRRWVKERFIDRTPQDKTLFIPVENFHGEVLAYRTRKWLHSSIFDNKALMESDPSYVASLASLEPRLRAVWFEGSWDFNDNMAFDEFDRRIHTCDPFEIPPSWYRFRACDWGYGRDSLAVCLWFAVDPEKTLYVYREFVANGDVPVEKKLNAPSFARRVLQLEQGESVKFGVIDGSTAGDGGKRSGLGPTSYDMMLQAGCKWNIADRGAGSRKHGKQLVHHYLSFDHEIGRPRIIIFNNCVQLIKELSSLPVDKNDTDDVDSNAEDHAYDALRYGLQSRPMFSATMSSNNSIETWFKPQKSTPRPIAVNPTVGY